MQEVFFPGKIFYTDYKIPRPILPSAASISLSIHMLHAELHAQPVACVLYGNFNIIAVVAHAVVFTRKAEPELHAAAAFAARHVFKYVSSCAASYVSFVFSACV